MKQVFDVRAPARAFRWGCWLHRKRESQGDAVKLRVTNCILACPTTNHRNKHKQPKQWVATDFLKERFHGKAMFSYNKRLRSRIRLKSNGLLGTKSVAKSNGSTHSDTRLRLHQTPAVAREMGRACCSCSSAIALLLVNESYSQLRTLAPHIITRS
jgi:hypothetical protein